MRLEARTARYRQWNGLNIEKPRLCGIKEWINEDGSRYVVFLFRTDRLSGELVSSDEGKVFRMEKEDVLKSNWIWHMDGLMRIMADGEHSELYLDPANERKPVLK